MTLPFRRRHHDHEASHDRARAIVATSFIEPTDAADAAWLEQHLAGCGECRMETDAYRADREFLRGLRERAPEPPRDLWARTATSIERERSRQARGPVPAVAERRLGRLPFGVLSGVLIILVVLGTSLIPRSGPPPIGPDNAAGTITAFVSAGPEATPLAVTAKALSWVQKTSDGTFELVVARVDAVCVTDPNACAPLEDASSTRLALSAEPQAVVLSPSSEELVIVSAATADGGGEVLVVTVPNQSPIVEPLASPALASPPIVSPAPASPPIASPPIASPPIAETPEPPASPSPELSPDVSLDPGQTPGPSESPLASAGASEPRAILTGVIVVGDTAYSADGRWLAFSARPIDGLAGPDLYLWRVGDPTAVAVTADHRTFFAGWLGNRVIASRVEPAEPAVVAETPDPLASAPPPSPTATPERDDSPEASPEASEAPVEDHPISFLLDPETSAVTTLAGQDIWLPVVSSSARSVVYWSGTLIPDGTGTGWVPGTGQIVLDGWIDPAAPPTASPDPGASPSTSATPVATATPVASAMPDASIDPLSAAASALSPGPAGLPVVLAAGPLAGFEASFDPTGTRLAIWVADPANADLGTLRLVTLDAASGTVQSDIDPLPGVVALRGFSIGEGRLAWVTPPGQDGEASHVQVLAWSEAEFGLVRSAGADQPVVAR